jgi:hypothetical protein
MNSAPHNPMSDPMALRRFANLDIQCARESGSVRISDSKKGPLELVCRGSMFKLSSEAGEHLALDKADVVRPILMALYNV